MNKGLHLFAFLFLLLFLTSIASGGLIYEPVGTQGLGNTANYEIYPSGLIDGYLYFGSYNMSGGYAWRTNDGASFTELTTGGYTDPDNRSVWINHQSFGGKILAHTYNNNASVGQHVYYSATGEPHTTTAWTASVNDGFYTWNGETAHLLGPNGCAIVRDSTLYMGSSHDGINGAEVYSTDSSGLTTPSWTQEVQANVLIVPACTCHNYTTSAGLFDGAVFFGTDGWCCGGALLFNSSPWSYVTGDAFNQGGAYGSILVADQGFSNRLYVGVDSAAGAQIWRSCLDTEDWTNEANWTKVLDFADGTGMGTAGADTANSAIKSFSIPGDGYIYFTTGKGVGGSELWRSKDGTEWEQAVEDGYGDTQNYNSFLAKHSLGDWLYVGTANSGGGKVYRIDLSKRGDGTTSTGETTIIKESGSIEIVGSTERKGIINPDKGDKVEIYFEGQQPGKYTLRIFNLLGELIYEDSKNSLSGGTFSWIPEDIASGIYIVSVVGPGVNINKKMAILR